MLTKTDSSNAQWQRDLIVSLVKLGEVTSNTRYATQALEIALGMHRRGILAPRDIWMIDDLKRRAGQPEPGKDQ